MTKQGCIAQGNRLMRERAFERAIQCFAAIDTPVPGLVKICAENIVLARRYAIPAAGVQNAGVLVAGPSEARAQALSGAYAAALGTGGRCAVFSLPADILALHESQSDPLFLSHLLRFVRANPYQLVHLAGISVPAVAAAVLYRLLWGSTLLIDVDVAVLDSELNTGVFRPRQHARPLGVRDLVRMFDAHTVATPALQQIGGGDLLGLDGGSGSGACPQIERYLAAPRNGPALAALALRFVEQAPPLVQALLETPHNIPAGAGLSAVSPGKVFLSGAQPLATQGGPAAAAASLEEQLRQSQAQVQRLQDEVRRIAGGAVQEAVQRLIQPEPHAAAVAGHIPGISPSELRALAAVWGMQPLPAGLAALLPSKEVLVERMERLFDAAFYRSQLELPHGEDAFQHFCRQGWADGKDPNCLFSVGRYLALHPDAAHARINPLLHYVVASQFAVVDIGGVFAASFYTERHGIVAGGLTPLEHFVFHGLPQGEAPCADIAPPALLRAEELQAGAWRAAAVLLERIAYSAALESRLAPPSFERPAVSIVIYANGHSDAVASALALISAAPWEQPFEVIVAADGAAGPLTATLAGMRNVRYLAAQGQAGWSATVNRAVASAAGEYAIVLGGDIELRPGWAEEILATLSRDRTVDLVGAKILDGAGALRHAGTLLWQDASVTVIGGAVTHPSVNYLRDVDGVSPLLFGCRTQQFLSAGGLHPQFRQPADAMLDLACALRARGGRAVYQPLATVVAFGVGAQEAGDAADRALLQQRWQPQLAALPPPGEARQRGRIGHIMVVDQITPTPDRDAGSVTQAFILEILVRLGWAVSFVPEATMENRPGYTQALQRIGVQCVYAPHYQNLYEFVRDEGRTVDVAMLYKGPPTVHYLNIIGPHCPQARILFDTVDVHYLREMREAELAGSSEMMAKARRTKTLELEAMKRSDCTIVLSHHERELLEREAPDVRLAVLPLILDCPGPQVAAHETRDICFIGGFLHQPNRDAVLYFAEQIWPQIHARLPAAKFRIMGSHAPPEVLALASDSVVIDGFVPDLATSLGRCRISVAPLRYGAGIKGKVGSSLSYGIPCVATSLAAEGMGLGAHDGVEVADDPQEFADRVVRLYQDAAYWSQMSAAGIAFVEREYSLRASAKRIAGILDELGFPAAAGTATLFE
jgi:glycosyltransferase involved in cell wall biosynthesis